MVRQSAPLKDHAAARGYDRRRTIQSCFSSVAETARGPALLCSEGAVSYAELDRRSNAFARRLKEEGVRAGAIVALYLPRSADAIIAMLGVLKAGAAFAPLDPAYPADHLAFIVSDAAPALVVSTAEMLARAPAPGASAIATPGIALPWSAPTLLMDREAAALAAQSDAPLEDAGSGDDLAYVMYTSGTTGRPKGVMVPHRGVARLALNSFVDLSAADVVLQFAPLAFDASTFEIWSPLLNGASVAVFEAEHPSFAELGAAIRRRGVTTAWLTASLFHAVVDHQIEILRPLRQLIAGGDVLSPRHVRRVLDEMPHLRVVNGYGPTENTTFTCCYEIPRDAPSDAAIPVGRAIDHTQAHVLDAALHPVPDGEEGELFAAGEGVALGYLNRPDLTAEKFLADPFASEPGALMYRTGDLVRRRSDGVVEFMGRADRQVKIHGKRVELDEVEALARRLPEIADATALVRSRTDGDRQIVAFVSLVPGATADPAELRRQMLELAPDFMTPAHIGVVAELPRTPNGKVDRAALLALFEGEAAGQGAAPAGQEAAGSAVGVAGLATDYEAELAAIWRRLLRIGGVGLDANFFDLGGASLDIMALQDEIRTRLHHDVPMTALFEFTTIRSLAAYLMTLGGPAGGEAAAGDRAAVDELSSRKARQAEALKRASKRRLAEAR